MAGDLAGGVNDFFDGKADAVAQIKDVALAAVHQIIHRQNMRLCQIRHMDVVSNTGAVLGVVVIAKNRNVLALSVGNLQNQRNQMRFRIVRLADFTGDMGATGVEVAQRYKPQAMCLPHPFEHLFHAQLGLAVAVGRLGLVRLQNRHALRLAVCRSCRRKNNLVNAVRHHGFQQNLCAAQIVVIIFERIGHGFADERICRKMNDAVNVFRFKNGIHKFAIANVTLIKFCLRMHRFDVSGLQIVRNDDVAPCVYQFIYGVRANVARAAKYQNCHICFLLMPAEPRRLPDELSKRGRHLFRARIPWLS